MGLLNVKRTLTGVPKSLQNLRGMVGLPGGEVRLGAKRFPDAQPVRTRVSAIAIGETAVTNREYQAFLSAQKGLQQYALQFTSPTGEKSILARADETAVFKDHIARLDLVSGMGLEIISQERLVALPSPKGFDGDDQPVVLVIWAEAMRYCQWKAEMLSRETGNWYIGRLPTEAEWEYAARAGREGDKVYGTDTGKLEKRKGTLSGWNAHWNKSDKITTTSAVRAYPPNQWGLYEMSGNVWEWCLDWYSPNAYEMIAADSPRGPETGAYRVLRGGSWYFVDAESVLAACRDGNHPGYRGCDFGFRAVVAPQDFLKTA